MFSPSDEVGVSPMEPSSSDQHIVSAGTPPALPDFPSSEIATTEAENSQWRNEVADRLSRYRARRKAPPPRYPSLKLPFGAVDGLKKVVTSESPTFESISNQALALEMRSPEPPIADSLESAPLEPPPRPAPPISRAAAKVIEFPRFAWAPPAPPPDQLAEPVIDRPRILDVPEMPPPAPALGGITIEPVQSEEPSRRPGIDIPLYAAPMGLRMFASVVDAFIVLSASALFGLIFSKITATQPPRLQLIALSAGIPCLFWSAYHYLLIVYSGTTPGLRAANLELVCFSGAPAKRSLRRWRILASYLSAASLGMGYAWLFLDEDSLCWHDRITRTYLSPRKPPH